ncbi:hypothetical protein [Bdellovibrio bacteriovorus]|uniref:hypothetical protein n=1 Tax=Bdellovibrio bacteriovorus TaxID=959 RepID=UPI00155DE266|nr:hypothetical protein [Bdellovibrio bacteriovorus]
MMRVQGLNYDQIKQIGIEFVGVGRGKPPKAWVEFKALEVRVLEYPDKKKLSLDVIPETTHHNRHANIKDLSKQNYEDWVEEAKILAEKIPMTLFEIPETTPSES